MIYYYYYYYIDTFIKISYCTKLQNKLLTDLAFDSANTTDDVYHWKKWIDNVEKSQGTTTISRVGQRWVYTEIEVVTGKRR